MADADERTYDQRYYAENRDRRLAQTRAYQETHREERRAYMREYAKRHPEKFKRTPEQQAEYNRRRRERYANDAEFREKHKAEVRARDKRAKRDGRLRAQFGITVDEYDAMLAAQGGGCAICGVQIGDGSGRRLSVDHCHDTGKVRGILCSSCNLGLGKFAHDPERLERAATYLR